MVILYAGPAVKPISRGPDPEALRASTAALTAALKPIELRLARRAFP